MKIWVASYTEHGADVGAVFSSKEKAEASIQHVIDTAKKMDGSKYSLDEFSIEDFELDEYYVKNFSPLAKALE